MTFIGKKYNNLSQSPLRACVTTHMAQNSLMNSAIFYFLELPQQLHHLSPLSIHLLYTT